MPSIIIYRSKEYTNGKRNIKIYIDDVLTDAMANGEIKKIPVEPGQHKIKAVIDWCSSPELLIDVHSDENTELSLSAYKYATAFAAASIVILLFGIMYQRLLYKSYESFWLLAIPLAVTFYYRTFGRKKYLRLEPKTDLF
jgi:hypothetical protein